MTFVKLFQSTRRVESTQRQTTASDLNDAHEKAWASLLATQTADWHRLVKQQQTEYNQACARKMGLVNEVALLRGHIQKLVSVDRQHEQEKENLRICQVQERADLYASLFPTFSA